MQGGISPPPWVISSIDALSEIVISVTFLCSRQNIVVEVTNSIELLYARANLVKILLFANYFPYNIPEI